MIDLLDSIKIQELKRYSLHNLEDIAKYLNIWESFSDEKKEQTRLIGQPLITRKFGIDSEEVSKEELLDLLKNPDFIEHYEDDLVYGEITSKGIFKLSEYLNNLTGNFYDIGSGNGKVIFQMSISSNFEKFTGIEIVETRHLYAKKIQQDLVFDRIDLICDDILNCDISDANVIFMNDVMFSKKLIKDINQKIPKDCYYFSYHTNDIDEMIDTILIDVSWSDVPYPINFYRKR